MFRIGNIVRRINDSFGGMNEGNVGTVIYVDGENISIKEFGGVGKYHFARNFELVFESLEEKPKKVIKRFGIADFMDGLNKK